MSTEHEYQQLPAAVRGEARRHSALSRVRAGASSMPPLAVAGALLLVAGAATWAGGALAAKAATRQVFTWAGVEHAFIDRLELAVVVGSAVLIPWVVGLALYSAWWKGGSAGGGSNNNSGSDVVGGAGGGGGGDSGTLLLSSLTALAVSTLLLSATVTWTADMDAARDRLGGGPGHSDSPGGGGGWGPPHAARAPGDAAAAYAAAYAAGSDLAPLPFSAPAAPHGAPNPVACPAECLDISAVVKIFKLPLPPCFCGQRWLLADLYSHMDDALRGLAAAGSGAGACWLGSVALLLWASEERVLAVGGTFGG